MLMGLKYLPWEFTSGLFIKPLRDNSSELLFSFLENIFLSEYPKVLEYHKLDPLLYWMHFDIWFAFLILSTDYIVGYVVDNTPFGAGDKMSDGKEKVGENTRFDFQKVKRKKSRTTSLNTCKSRAV